MLNPKEKYFFASFRYNKNKPGDFGLSSVSGEVFFVDKNEKTWVEDNMWDEGWGAEYGFVRIPRLNAKELWFLLMESNIYENQRGSAEFLDRLFPFALKDKLEELFNSKNKLNRELTRRLSHLEVLRTGINRSEVLGKSKEEVKKDYQNWKKLKDEFEKMKHESIWRKIINFS